MVDTPLALASDPSQAVAAQVQPQPQIQVSPNDPDLTNSPFNTNAAGQKYVTAVKPGTQLSGVDPRLQTIINTAAQDFPYPVKIVSGFRQGDPRFHGKGEAMDIVLYDPATGKAIPNYQNADGFRAYEQFAQAARQVQQQQYPDLNDNFRWGGYFGGPSGKYGASDLMHFDLGGDQVGMAGGSWENGLTAQQRKLLPGAQSIGLNQVAAQQASAPPAGNGQSTYDRVVQQSSATLPTQQTTALLNAYQSGAMPPEQMQQFEQDVHSGLLVLPNGVHIGGGNANAPANGPGPQTLPQGVIQAYNIGAKNPYDPGAMPDEARQQLDHDLQTGLVQLPQGSVLNPHYMGLMDKASELVTGKLRSTPQTEAAQDIGNFPAFSNGIGTGAKVVLGTVAANPQQTAQIIQANYPGAQISQDAKGNYLIDYQGQRYAIKPGMSLDDLARGGLQAAAFTPAGRAETIAGGAIASAATQAGLEGAKAGAGGDFDPTAVGVAGAIGGAVPVVSRIAGAGVSAAKQALGRGGQVADQSATSAASAGQGATAAAQPATPVAAATQTAPAVAPANPTAIVQATPKAAAAIATTQSENAGVIAKLGENISGMESGGKYDAIGPVTKSGDRAYGKFGVMGNNVPSWTKETLGKAMTPQEFVADPAAQEAVFAHRMGNYLSQTGNPRDAASMWLTGRPLAQGGAQAADQLGTTGAQYAAKATQGVEPTSSELAQTAKTAAKGGFGSKQAMQTLAEGAAQDPETIAAAQRLGIADYLQPDHTSTSQSFRELIQGIKSVPGSEARAQEQYGLQAVGQRATDLIDQVGGTQDLSQLSADVKGKLQSIQQDLQTKGDALYDQIRSAIPAQTPAPATNVLNWIKQRADDLGGVENLSSQERMIFKKLSPKAETPASVVQAAQEGAQPFAEGQRISAAQYREFMAAKQSGQATAQAGAEAQAANLKEPNYALLDDVRKDINASLYANRGPFKDADTGMLKKLSGLLTADQGAVAESQGAGDLFSQARDAVKMRKGVEDDLSSIFGKHIDGSLTPRLNSATGQLAVGNSAGFEKLISAVPAEMRQRVAASALNTAFGKSTQNGALNFNTYVRWFEGLQKNQQAYAALMSNLKPETAKQLNDLYKVSKGINNAVQQRIQTGRIQAIKDEFQGPDSLMQRLYDAAGKVAQDKGKIVAHTALGAVIGHPGAGLASALGSAVQSGAKESAIKAADKLIASPEFVQTVADAAKGNIKPAASRLAYSKSFMQFARALGNPREMTNKEKWITQALQNRNNQEN